MAVHMFIKMTGVTGGSLDKKHKEECDVLAFSWGMQQSGNRHLSGGGGAGKVHVHDMSFTKFSDVATGTIMQFCCNGKHVSEAVLTVRRAGGTTAPVEIVMTMTDVLITSMTAGGSGGEDRFTENVTLNFAKVSYTASGQDSSGAAATGMELIWDIAGNAGA